MNEKTKEENRQVTETLHAINKLMEDLGPILQSRIVQALLATYGHKVKIEAESYHDCC